MNSLTIYGLFTAESKRRIDLTHDQESATLAAFKRVLMLIEPTCFFDIGSNIGIYTIVAAGIDNIKTIYAFEPTPSTYSLLLDNISLQNNLSKIQAYQLALSNTKGKANFYDYGNEAGDNSLKCKKRVDPDRSPTVIDCDVDKLDNIFTGVDCIYAAKIDVEGAEFDVIDGASSTLTNNYGVIQIEHFGGRGGELVEKMKNLGYCLLIRVKEDYIFTNITDHQIIHDINSIYQDEIAIALRLLSNLNYSRRKTTRIYKKLRENVHAPNLSADDKISMYSKAVNEIQKINEYKGGDPIIIK
jgi:FkbM family methyltransferase